MNADRDETAEAIDAWLRGYPLPPGVTDQEAREWAESSDRQFGSITEAREDFARWRAARHGSVSPREEANE